MSLTLQQATVDPFNAAEQDSPTWGVFTYKKTGINQSFYMFEFFKVKTQTNCESPADFAYG